VSYYKLNVIQKEELKCVDTLALSQDVPMKELFQASKQHGGHLYPQNYTAGNETISSQIDGSNRFFKLNITRGVAAENEKGEEKVKKEQVQNCEINALSEDIATTNSMRIVTSRSKQ